MAEYAEKRAGGKGYTVNDVNEVKPAHVRRGRPPLMTAEELRERAIAVVIAHGYSDVTMSTVAAEIGVGVRTLHRHFSSKADLVWGAIDDSFEAVRDGLAAAPSDISIVAAVERAIVAAFRPSGEATAAGRARLRLVATTPELQAYQSVAFHRWRDAIAAFVAGRQGTRADDLAPVAFAAAAQGATMAALTWWATHDTELSAAECVARALASLDTST